MIERMARHFPTVMDGLQEIVNGVAVTPTLEDLGRRAFQLFVIRYRGKSAEVFRDRTFEADFNT